MPTSQTQQAQQAQQTQQAQQIHDSAKENETNETNEMIVTHTHHFNHGITIRINKESGKCRIFKDKKELTSVIDMLYCYYTFITVDDIRYCFYYYLQQTNEYRFNKLYVGEGRSAYSYYPTEKEIEELFKNYERCPYNIRVNGRAPELEEIKFIYKCIRNVEVHCIITGSAIGMHGLYSKEIFNIGKFVDLVGDEYPDCVLLYIDHKSDQYNIPVFDVNFKR